MNNRLSLGLLPGLLLFTLIAGSAFAQEWKSVDEGDFHLEWMADGGSLKIVVSAPAEGWVAVGFDPTNKMKDANILIGYVENGRAVVEDHYANNLFSHRSDLDFGGSRDVSEVSGRESAGTTELSFSIPLISGDEYDRPLVVGEKYKVILAYNKRDRISVKHNERESVEITL
ncbi:MAG: DOMON domain-containing protein [Spirochaetaceae bacterium]|nr:DOMON domain-containing protein [Spirochaetaceae bacterium]